MNSARGLSKPGRKEKSEAPPAPKGGVSAVRQCFGRYSNQPTQGMGYFLQDKMIAPLLLTGRGAAAA
jgi:hypothetical protein